MNSNIKNIEKRKKEIAKEYQSKGFTVSINPMPSELPIFLRDFEPDIIAISETESVVIEVKAKDSLAELKKYEGLANLISKMKNWRFEIVFVNPLEQNIQPDLTIKITKADINHRLLEVNNLIEANYKEAAFLLGWATLESAIRIRLSNEEGDKLNKSTVSIIKTIYSLGYVNQRDYKMLEKLNDYRNRLVHGFDLSVDLKAIKNLLDLIKYLIGDSKKNIMYGWLEGLDLDEYQEIYSLYTSIKDQESFGAFIYQRNDKIVISCTYVHEHLELDNEDERIEFLKLIEDEYMNDMDPETWFSFNRSMEKDD